MKRHQILARNDWQKSVSDYGLVWHGAGKNIYWDEGAYYSFSPLEIENIKTATSEIYHMYVAAGEFVIRNRLFALLDIPKWCEQLIIETWEKEPICLNYGRFDFGYDGQNIKLFEFNCDTPTSLLEASIIQYYWQQEVFPNAAQFNEIHETLVEKFRDIKPLGNGDKYHFTCAEEETGEDLINTAYMMDCAIEAGLNCELLPIHHIGWHENNYFIDTNNLPIKNLYKLYPWEWLISEEYGSKIPEDIYRANFIEPIWKLLWSNKAILTIISNLFPDSPYILKASHHPLDCKYVEKPIHAREGANIKIVDKSNIIHTTKGDYNGNTICQEFFQTQSFYGRYPIIGSWIIDGHPSGIGIREGDIITNNAAKFIPHIIE